jgi:excisionase family DNA binding protein
MSEELLKTRDVAKLLNVAHSTVTRWIRLGQIRYVKLPGGTYRIPREEVEKLLRRDGEEP